MPIKVYGTSSSPYFRLVALVATQAGVAYELVTLARGEVKTAPHNEKQPFAQLPYMVCPFFALSSLRSLTGRGQDEDGFVLFESRAIARYIAEKAPGAGLIPPATDLRARALFEQAASIETSNFTPHALKIAIERIGKPSRGEIIDEVRVEEELGTLSGKLEGYERILAKQRYLAGEQLTLADLFHLPIGSLLPQAGVSFLSDAEKFPNVAR